MSRRLGPCYGFLATTILQTTVQRKTRRRRSKVVELELELEVTITAEG